MRHRSNWWVARLLLAVMVFAQASFASADCPADRSRLWHAIAPEVGAPCEPGMVSMTGYGPLNANRCVAHCTADLQIAAAAVAIVRSPADTPVLLVPRLQSRPVFQTGLEAPAPGTPPPRVLLHAYLI